MHRKKFSLKLRKRIPASEAMESKVTTTHYTDEMICKDTLQFWMDNKECESSAIQRYGIATKKKEREKTHKYITGLKQ